MADLKKLGEAVGAAKAALAKDPENEALKTSVSEAEKALADAQAEAAEAKKPKSVEVRVLLDHRGHKADTVITLDAASAKQAEEEGWADANPKAVAFAKAEARQKQGG